jgi:hypothetical protein
MPFDASGPVVNVQIDQISHQSAGRPLAPVSGEVNSPLGVFAQCHTTAKDRNGRIARRRVRRGLTMAGISKKQHEKDTLNSDGAREPDNRWVSSRNA